MWINEQTQGTCILHADIRHELWKAKIEAPGVLTDEYLASVGYPTITKVIPAYNPITQGVTSGAPVQVDGQWTLPHTVVALDPAIVANNCYQLSALTPEITAILEGAGHLTRIQAEIEQRRVSRLWQAAHDYEYAQISGSAIGLLSLGVMQAKPKCIAVQNWIKSIWVEYYTRKFGASSDCDFTVVGPCPHSVPELMAELGV